MEDTHRKGVTPGLFACLGYTLLFLVPVVGLGFLLAFSASEQDTPRRRFARANLCLFLMLTTSVLLLLLTGAGVRLAGAMHRG